LFSLCLTLAVVCQLPPEQPTEIAKPDVLVVCPSDFLGELKPWIAHRSADGHTVKVISNLAIAEEIRSKIKSQHAISPLKAVLLIGNAPGPAIKVGGGSSTSNAPPLAAEPKPTETPTFFKAAKVNVLWGSEPEIATDFPYSDLDGDSLGDVAVGRLPAKTAAELKVMIDKIIRYETEAPKLQWAKRVNVVAGVGDFGLLADRVLEMATKWFLVEAIPAGYEVTATYGSWRSPFCPDPRQFEATAVERMNEGCLFWVYIGHGQRQYLAPVNAGGKRYRVLDNNSAPKVKIRAGGSINLFLACYVAAFDGEKDCLGEALLKQPAGPVAVLGGSRVTMPYAMGVMSNAMLDGYFVKQQKTLGDLVLSAKDDLVSEPEAEEQASQRRAYLDALAATLSPSKKMLAEERREHTLLFNLLGDPLLKLPRSQAAKVELENDVVDGGEKLAITLNCPIDGECELELVRRRDGIHDDFQTRGLFEGDDVSLAAYQKDYNAVHDRTIARGKFSVQADKPLQTSLSIPVDARGLYVVRASINGKQHTAIGAADVTVHRAASVK
jgi:hypothetical protein